MMVMIVVTGSPLNGYGLIHPEPYGVLKGCENECIACLWFIQNIGFLVSSFLSSPRLSIMCQVPSCGRLNFHKHFERVAYRK